MTRRLVLAIVALLQSVTLLAQEGQPNGPPAPPAQPGVELAEGLAQRVGKDLHVRTTVGEPMRVGAVTLIPVMMTDVSFGGGAPAPPPASGTPIPAVAAVGTGAFFMSGEARPLGFVVVTKKGARFVSVAPALVR